MPKSFFCILPSIITRISIFIIVVLFSSCHNELKHELNGKIPGYNNQSIELQFLTYTSSETIEETTTDENGEFTIKTLLNEPGIYGIKINNGDYWIVLIENDKINVNIDINDSRYSSLTTNNDRNRNFLKAVKFIENIHLFHDSITRELEIKGLMTEDNATIFVTVDSIVNDLLLQQIEMESDPITIVYYLRWLDSHLNYHYLGKKIDMLNKLIPNSVYTKELNDIYAQLSKAYQQGLNFKSGVGAYRDTLYIPDFKFVEIGNQIWMAENLNIATPNSWCLYNRKENCQLYGRVYNWYDAMSACPTGWHLPSDEEWMELEKTLGMKEEEFYIESWRGEGVGGKLKAVNPLWNQPNAGANNSSGFNALPGGPRYKFGMYGNFGKNATFWTATEHGGHQSIFRYLGYTRTDIGRSSNLKLNGHSVRCIKD